MSTVEERKQEEENPLAEGLERLPIRPTTMTIFGATGDLAKRKLLPAFYNLAHEGALPEPFNRCFYLSTAPEFFPVIVKALGEHELNQVHGADVRVIIEKPFGTSLREASELNDIVLSVFREEQIFRIDHYLGKETVQNMLA